MKTQILNPRTKEGRRAKTRQMIAELSAKYGTNHQKVIQLYIKLANI
jgi:hypothetical protein